MICPHQTLGSLVLSLAVGAFAVGCSSAELAGVDDYSQADETGSAGTTGDPTEGDPTGDPTDGSTETDGEAGTDEGDDEGLLPTIEDPSLGLEACDPVRPPAEQFVAHDLVAAQLELVATLVGESVLRGNGEVPLVPLAAQSFFNHFEFEYPPSETAELAISGELWKPPMVNADAPPRYRLQYALRGSELIPAQRAPVDLAIVVDLGPSMDGEPLMLAAEALSAIDDALVPGDRVTLIAAGEQPTVLAASATVEQFGEVMLTGLLDDQAPAPTANVELALELAYTTVAPYWAGQGQQRVLLISNGHFVIEGAIEPGQLEPGLVAQVEDHAADGRYLVTLALGDPSLVADASLRELAAQGRGPLLYDADEAGVWRDLSERFAAHMIATATEIEVSLTLPTGLTIRQRDPSGAKIGEPERAFLGANDTIIFHHEIETCGDLDPTGQIQVEVTWNDPISNEAKQTVWIQSVAALGAGSNDTRKGAAVVAYVRALRGYRDGVPSSDNYGAVLDAISLIANALEAQPEDADLIEMSQVLGQLEM